MTEVWLVRHGATAWSAAGRHTGTTDVALTAAGERAARALAPKLAGHSFAAVLSSPLQRARRTAELAGFAAVTLDDDLREWDYGADEGRTTAQIRADRPGWTVWRDGPSGGESADAVGARCDRALARVQAIGGDVLVFAHGHLLRVFAARWCGWPPGAGSRLALGTAAVGVLGYERETAVIVRWNDGPAPP